MAYTVAVTLLHKWLLTKCRKRRAIYRYIYSWLRGTESNSIMKLRKRDGYKHQHRAHAQQHCAHVHQHRAHAHQQRVPAPCTHTSAPCTSTHQHRAHAHQHCNGFQRVRTQFLGEMERTPVYFPFRQTNTTSQKDKRITLHVLSVRHLVIQRSL